MFFYLSISNIIFSTAFIAVFNTVFNTIFNTDALIINEIPQLDDDHSITHDYYLKYDLINPLILHCKIKSGTNLTYIWKKNGITLYENNSIILIKNNTLELYYTSNISAQYQCMISNNFGVAISNFINVYDTIINTTHNDIKYIYIDLNESVNLTCFNKNYYKISWIIYKNNLTKTHIKYNLRRSIGYDGTLYISNVIESDYSVIYKCLIYQNSLIIEGPSYKLINIFNNNTSQYKYPKLEWYSKQNTIIDNNKIKLKCIFSGFPTPFITWVYPNNNIINDTEIKVSYAGNYSCIGYNNKNSSIHTFIINKASKPKLLNNITIPINNFIPKVYGIPTPSIEWKINGINSNISLHNLSLEYCIIQLNISNIHGSVIYNIPYMNDNFTILYNKYINEKNNILLHHYNIKHYIIYYIMLIFMILCIIFIYISIMIIKINMNYYDKYGVYMFNSTSSMYLSINNTKK